jgi:hypothetical protein
MLRSTFLGYKTATRPINELSFSKTTTIGLISLE